MKKRILRRETSSTILHPTLHPILNRVYIGRGVQSAQELETELTQLLPYPQLLNINAAVDLLYDALKSQARLLIIGDFDADGATATAIAMLALQSFGATNVDYLVPNRFVYGYGLTPEIVQVAHARRPDIIITVDNGISSFEGVKTAKSLNIKVLITDHHLSADHLPEAEVIINPNQPQDIFPSKCIAGCGVIFYVMLALRARLRETGWFETQCIPIPNMASLLDLVAVGTIADVVSLDKNNRILVYQGLKRIQAQACRPGLLALLEVARRPAQKLKAQDLGFTIGPRLNAAGRLEDMSLGIECLLTPHKERALELAQQLDQLNQERRAIEMEMQHQATATLNQLSATQIPAGICLFEENWHQGVIGIVAGRIKDKFHRPAIAFANASNTELKGSGRSIPGFHLRDALADIATRHPDLLQKFGGHAMAAGLSIHQEDFSRFSRIFNAQVEKTLSPELLNACVLTDGELSLDDFNLDLVDHLESAGPFGTAFPEPVFDNEFEVLQQFLVGGRHLRMVLSLPGYAHFLSAIAFSIDTQAWPNPAIKRIHAAYRLSVNDYQNMRKIQLILDHIEAV